MASAPLYRPSPAPLAARLARLALGATGTIRIAGLLDELIPRYDDRTGEWERVSAYAHVAARRPLRSSLRVRVTVVAGVVAAAATLVLAWSFGTQRPSLLSRALAAVGDAARLTVRRRRCPDRILEHGGLQIAIEAVGEDAILAAAHALEPMPK